ncbi:MAG: NAD(P)/FAD-dependent oxidoreductase [Stackebrandtia sp.]
MSATVSVIGGGYGGITVAKALDEVAEVILIEPRDTFVHNVAALRGLTDPDWTDKLFLPYDRLLSRGRWVRDRAARVDATSVTLGSGRTIDSDYTVLATGSGYPFPAKTDTPDAATAKAKFHATRKMLADVDDILLLGAGPVGLELAGELKAVWPEKSVTIVDPGADILSGRYPDEFRDELRRQLEAAGVRLLLGTSLTRLPPVDAGEAGRFTATTDSGDRIEADLWFRCYGGNPATEFLAGELSGARRDDGSLDVTEQLRLHGQDRVFAIGDITAIPEPKMAKAAGDHATVVAENIVALITGEGELKTYQPGKAGIVLPLGPTGGASYVDGMGLLDAEQTADIKGANLLIDRFAEKLGLA